VAVLLISTADYVSRILGIGLLLVSMYFIQQFQIAQKEEKNRDFAKYKSNNTNISTILSFVLFIISAALGLYLLNKD